jgi:hypothetical protein
VNDGSLSHRTGGGTTESSILSARPQPTVDAVGCRLRPLRRTPDPRQIRLLPPSTGRPPPACQLPPPPLPTDHGSGNLSNLAVTSFFRAEVTAVTRTTPHSYTNGNLGFHLSVGAWFRGPGREILADVLLSPRSLDRGYFEPATVRPLLEDHMRGPVDHGGRLSALLQLEVWHRYYVDAAPSSSGASVRAVGRVVELDEERSHREDADLAGRVGADRPRVSRRSTPRAKEWSPAAVHVDGIARPQLIDEATNPAYYRSSSATRSGPACPRSSTPAATSAITGMSKIVKDRISARARPIAPQLRVSLNSIEPRFG